MPPFLVLKKTSMTRLKKLHWLPISDRINYKIASLTYQCTNNIVPEYLSDRVAKTVAVRNLRSSEKNVLKVPDYSMKSYGYRCFSMAAANVWNKLLVSSEHLTLCSK